MSSLSIVLLSGSILDIDGTALVHLAIFFIAFFMLRALVFRPLLTLFDAREEATIGAREAARTMQREANEKGETFESELRSVRLKAGTERERLRLEARKREQEILDEVAAEVKTQSEAMRTQLDTKSKRLRAEIDGQVPALARSIASKLLNREIS